MDEKREVSKVRGRWEVKRWLSYIVALSLAMSLIFVPEIEVSAAAYTGNYSGGSGTESSPYLLSKAADIENFVLDERSDMYYRVTTDITSAAYISQPRADFDGVLDGYGHSINVQMDYNTANSYGSDIALVNELSGTIQNLTMHGGVEIAVFDSYYDEYVGYNAASFAVSVNSSGRILYCSSDMTLTALDRAAGIALSMENGGQIIGCSFSGYLELESENPTCAGGILYGMSGGVISSCVYNGSTFADTFGQIVYDITSHSEGNIQYCYGLDTRDDVGAVVYSVGPYSVDVPISNCYAICGNTDNGGSITLETNLKNSSSAAFKALNSNGTYLLSSSVNNGYPYIVTPAVLEAPTGFGAVNVSVGSVELSWDAVDGARRYDVYYGPTTSYGSHIYTTSTSYTVTNLDAATYYFKVVAINGEGHRSLNYSTISIKTYEDVEYTDKTLYGTYARPFNEDVGDATGGSGSFTYKLNIGELPRDLSVSSSGNISGHPVEVGEYMVGILATDTNTGLTKEATIEIIIDADEPFDPTDFNAVRQSDGSIKCTWNAINFDGDGLGGVTYRIFGADSTITVPTKGATSYTIPASQLTMGKSYTLKVDATNSSGIVSDYSDQVTVIPYVDMAYTNKTLSSGTVGTAYSQSVAHATGGYGTTTYALKSGQTLPAGLSLSSNGTVSGTPTTAVTNKTFIVVAKNSAGSKEATMTLTINKGASSITTKPTGKTLTYTGSAQSLVTAGTASGGTLQYCVGSTTGTWTTNPTATAVGTYKVYYKVVGDTNHNDVAASTSNYVTATIGKAASSVTTKPTGKTLTYTGSAQALVSAGAASGGTIQYCLTQDGTYSTTIPTATNVGTYTVWYKVVGDSNHSDVTASSVTATIGKGVSSVTTAPTAKSLIYTGKAQALVNAGAASGGTMQYSLTQNGTYSTTIPTGTIAGDYTVWYKVVGDANHNDTAAASVPVKIYAAAPAMPANFAVVRDGSGSVKLTWTNSTSDGDGKGGLKYKVDYGTNASQLNTKVELTSGQSITGLTNGQTYYFRLYAENASGETSKYTAILNAVPYADLSYPGGKTLSTGTVGTAYSASVAEATGGHGTTTYTLPLGAILPAGLTLNSNGTITGTPTAAGTYEFSITAANTAGSVTTTNKYKLQIVATTANAPTLDSAVRSGDGSVKVTWTAPSFNGGSDITGYVVSYKNTVSGQTGTASYGSDIREADITGLTNRNAYSFTVQAVNGIGSSTESNSVSATPYADVTYESKTLATGVKGNSYAQDINLAEGGLGSYTYEVTEGSLPNGLSLTKNTGMITGTAIESGTYEFTVTVTDSSGLTASTKFLIGIVTSLAYGGGSGTEKDPYIISTLEHWKDLDARVSGGESYAGTYFKLANDIDIGGNTIGTYRYFSGIFDGDYHVIKVSNGNGYGVFYRINGTVKNLGITGRLEFSDTRGVPDSNFYVELGALAQEAGGSAVIENCYNMAHINVVIGRYYYDFSEVTENYLKLGGLVGRAYANTKFNNCYNSGGISVEYSYNFGKYGIGATEKYVYGNSFESHVGGIAGVGGKFTNCYNTAEIFAEIYNLASEDTVALPTDFGDSLAEILSQPFDPYLDMSKKEHGNNYFGNISGEHKNTTNCYSVGPAMYDTGDNGSGTIILTDTEMKTADFVSSLGSAYKRDKAFVNDGFPIHDGRRPADITVAWSGTEFTYDGSAKSASVSAKRGSTAVLLENGDYKLTYSGSDSAPSSAGEYNTAIVLTDEGSRYFSVASGGTSTLTINPTNPGAPTEVKAERASATSAMLTWKAPEFDGDGKLGLTYNVYYGTDAANLQKYPTQLTSGQTVTGLTSGQTYYFAVSAVNLSKLEGERAAAAQGVLIYPDVEYTGKTLPNGKAGEEYSQSIASAAGGAGSFKYTLTDSVLPDGLELSEDGIISGTPTTLTPAMSFKVTAANAGGSKTAEFSLAIDASVPSKPTLEATSGEDGKVTLTWTAPEFTGGTQLSKYILQRSTDGKQFDTIREPMSVDTMYTDTDVTNGTTYYYRMFVLNSAGLQSDPSETASAKPYKVPEAPQGLTAAAIDKYSIELAWTGIDNGGDDITAYTIKVYSDENYQTEITSNVTVGEAADNKAVVSGLTKDTTYYFAVSATNAAGVGAEAKVSEKTFTSPSAPQSLNPEVASSTEIKLTWAAPENTGGQDVASYNVYYREKNTEAEQEWTKLDGIEGTEYTVGGLTPGQMYEFKVTAMNGTADDDESSDSDIVEIIPAEAPAAPTIGEIISKNASALITSIDVADNFGDAVNKYIIYTSTDGENFTKHTEIETSTDSSKNVLVEGLTNGTTYQIKVAAVNDFGESEMSNAQTVTVGMPLPPKNVKAVPKPGQKIEITFDAADAQGSNIVGYEVHIGGTKGEDAIDVDPEASENIIFTESTSLIYDASDRINGNTVTAYVVAVSDVFENAKSASSETAVAAIGSPGAPEITNLTADEQGIYLTWSAPESNGNAKVKYTVTIVDENDSEKKFDTAKASTLEMNISKEDGGLEPGKTYGAYVTCWNSAGEGPASKTWTFTFGAPQAPEVQEPEMGDKELTVKWSKPANNGGAEIIGYNIYLNDETEATMYVTWHSETAPYQLYITDYRKNNGEVAYGSGQDNLDNFEVIVDNLANGFAYSVRVTAVNVNGEGPSQETEEPVTPATKASAPRDIVANATSANDITISWNKPFRDGGTAVSGYFVSVIKTGEKNYETGDYDDVSSESEAWSGMINVGTTAEVGNLEAGSRYEVKVAANTAAGQGEFGTATVYTHSKPSKPVITELISGVGETKTLPLTVSWNAPEDIGDSPIIGYDVYANRSIYPNDKYKMNLESMIAADKTEYVINDIRLENGTEYDITVVAYNAVTGTEYNNGVSSEKKTITLGTVPPPKNIKAAGDVLGNLNITWSTEQYVGIEQYIDRYIVYLDGVAVTSTNTNLAELKMIPKGVEHKIEIAVFSTFQQEGLKSEPIYYTIGAPEAVTGVNAQPAENGAIVTWTEVPAVDTYETTAYKVYVNGEVKQTINVGEATELKAELDGLTGGTEYSINVSAVNENGEGQKSDTVKVTPYAKPDAPIVKNIKGGIGSFSFTFDEPNGNGGTITGYEVFVDGSEVQASIVDNTVTVTGVEDGEPAHEFYIIAVSDKGLKSDAPEDPYEVVTGVPTPPENVTVIAGPGSATIIFDKSDDVDPDHPTTDYEVLDNGVPLDPQPEITETEDGKLIVTITPLEDGTEHSITIRPINDIGTGPESDPVVVKPGTPQAPEISKIVSGNGKLSIEWTEPEENSGRILYYTVYVSDGEGSDYTLAATTPITNAEIGDLTNGKSYLVKISATNYIGEGAMSDPMSGTPGAASGPVGEITAVPGYADGSCNITLTWDKPEDNGGLSITEYIVEGEGNITVDSANRTAVITGLDKGTEYTYTITPVNSAGNGESKTTESITTLTEPGAPILVEVNGVNRNITAVWTAPENMTSAEITGYVIYAEPVDGGDTIRAEYSTPIADENGEYTYVLTENEGVKVGYKYNVTVAAINIVGEGSKPTPIRVTVTEDIVQTAPGVPRDLTAAAGDGSVELSWKEPQYDGNSAITKYVIYSGTSVDSMGNIGEVDGHTFSFKRDGLKNGTTYYFKVKAVNAANADGGEFCDIVEAAPTQVTAPSKPTWVTFNNETGESAYETNAQGNAITIRWNESTGDEMFGQISYKVFVNGDLKTTTTDLSYVLENPLEDKQYNIQIKAVNEKGAESSSEFLRAYRGLNVRKSSEPGFSYPEQYQSGIYAYIDHDYDGIEDNKITPTKPSAPQNFAVTTDELNTEVILTWTAPANNGNAEIAKYNVYIDGTPETLQANDSGVLLEDGSYKYSYSIMGRAVHSFYVTAINAQDLEGDSTPIKYAPIEYNPAPSLTAPTDLEAAEIVGKTNIVLRWTAVDGAESYVLHVNGKPFELSSDDISADETKVSHTYHGEINMHYTFAVSAKAGSNESALSNIITVDTTEDKAEAPLDVMLTPGESSIMVTWNPPANLDETDTYEYIVYVNGDPVEERVSDCTYTINELKTVYVKVAAVCEHGTTGAQSETVSYEHNSVFDPSTPPKPLKLNYELKYADDGILLVNDNLELTWLPGEIVDGEHEADTETYNVYIGGNPVAEGVTGDPFIYVDGVEAGKDYLVEIEPLSADGKAGPKATINVEVPENEYQKPEKITDLTAELSEDNTAITLKWTESSDSDTYYYLVVNGEPQANTVNSGFEYTVDNSVHNYTFMLKSAKTYSDGTEVTEDSNQVPVNIPSIDPDPTPNPPNYEANPPEFIQYISDGVKNVKVFWKAPEPKENETGEIAEYKVVVDGTAVGTVSADASPLVYEIDCGSIGEKKVVEIQAYKDISGSMLLASTSVKATVTPGCNIVINPDDYTNDNPTLPVEVTNEDSNFTGTPTVTDEKIVISGKANATNFDMKLTDEFGNELKLSASDITFGNVETNGMTEFEVSFSAGDLDASATTYSVVFSRDAYTKYTVTGIPKADLLVANIENILMYAGDLNNDGVIAFGDSIIMDSNQGMEDAAPLDGDLNNDRVVAFGDSIILKGNIGKMDESVPWGN